MHFKATEYQVVKLFQEHGKIKREQFMYHRGGAKKGEPRGVMYIEYETEEEAAAGRSFVRATVFLRATSWRPLQVARALTSAVTRVAKDKLNGRLLIGRPLLVRLVDEQTSKEELMGEEDEWDQKEEEQTTSEFHKRREQEAEQAASAPGRLSSKAEQIAKIKAKLAAMADEDQSAADAAKSIGGDRYKPY